MRILAVLAILSASGCCYTHYSDARVTVSRLSIGSDSRANKISVTCGESSTTLRAGEIESNGAQAAGTVIGAAVKGGL